MGDNQVYIIAEAGVNHNGSLGLAKEMVDAALFAGVDAIKFQTFNTDDLVSAFAPKAEYQKQGTPETKTQKQMLEKLELGYRDQEILFQYTRQQGLDFLSSPFDLRSIAFLAGLGLDTIKIPSGEITNLPYLRAIGREKWKILLSTGMSFMEEVINAVDILVQSGTSKSDILVLHCNTQYPTPMEDVNLNAMPVLGAVLGLDYGYSDHTMGFEISAAAVAMGARVIEKHFTLDRSMPGPDQQASLDPEELKTMVKIIRNIESAMGTCHKRPSASEENNRLIARKSIVAAKEIAENEVFSPENLTVKRPGNGVSPMEWDRVMGMAAKRAYTIDEMIEL